MAGYIECDTWLGFASPIHEDFVTAEEFGIVVLLTLLQHLIHETYIDLRLFQYQAKLV